MQAFHEKPFADRLARDLLHQVASNEAAALGMHPLPQPAEQWLELTHGDLNDNSEGDYYDSPMILDTADEIAALGDYRYVKISTEGNTVPSWATHGTHSYAGLGEVQFFETYTAPVPEPATLGMLALGGLMGLTKLMRRRRR